MANLNEVLELILNPEAIEREDNKKAKGNIPVGLLVNIIKSKSSCPVDTVIHDMVGIIEEAGKLDLLMEFLNGQREQVINEKDIVITTTPLVSDNASDALHGLVEDQLGTDSKAFGTVISFSKYAEKQYCVEYNLLSTNDNNEAYVCTKRGWFGMNDIASRDTEMYEGYLSRLERVMFNYNENFAKKR